MSSASVSPHGFVTVRGRSYRPDQVDAYADALSEDRDAAWERAARLTVLAREMEEEAERLRETLAELPPQTYEALGEGARRLFQMAQEEAAAVRERARREAHEQLAQAEAHAESVRRAAQDEADALLAEVEERSRHRLLAAQAEADEIRVVARREVKEGRTEALSALREVRQRTDAMLAEQEKEHVERWAVAEREVVEGVAALGAPYTERFARAEAALSEATQDFADAEQAVGRQQEEARVLAAEVLAEARLHEDRIACETERVLREHAERRDDVQAHMDCVGNSLAELTGGHAPAE
ncbi:cellulose-binding protein [Streptomyces spinoverrucosus]|uniref:cellulose-binding protein n=1 Tax=Streptomyces spinoverrucosus TaxID=284043 RepID=UPI0018C3C2BB|nr:cellulose-binding protein [Streptomyces spinoverrucosus]MBG0854701.1 cellulose-binding protein [Streptomyces spinoverrucosus]